MFLITVGTDNRDTHTNRVFIRRSIDIFVLWLTAKIQTINFIFLCLLIEIFRNYDGLMMDSLSKLTKPDNRLGVKVVNCKENEPFAFRFTKHQYHMKTLYTRTFFISKKKLISNHLYLFYLDLFHCDAV